MVDTNLNQQGSAWMIAAQRDDRMAFHHLYTAFYPHIVRFCIRMLSDKTRGEEAAQETFVDLYKARARYKASGSFKSYIFTLAANRCRKDLRKKRETALPEFWDQASDTADPEQQVIEQELAMQLSQAFATLPNKQRAAFALIQEQGLSYDEAATALKASTGAVKTWVFRARTTLKNTIEAYQ